MLTHAKIWGAIDGLAKRHGYSASGLARRSGLDPTTFNKSKRITVDGRPRWPSTESVAKVLDATGSSLEDFLEVAEGRSGGTRRGIPIIGLAQAGSGGYFDDSGLPTGSAWEEITFPAAGDEAVYALEVTGDSMLPLYRDGDIIVVSPAQGIRRNDRVVVKTREGEVMAKILKRRTAKAVELSSLNPDHPDRLLAADDVAWLARIVWASQ